jgi:hypothetical protein
MSKIVVRNTVAIHTTFSGIKKIWKTLEPVTPVVSYYLTDNYGVALTDNFDEYLTT